MSKYISGIIISKNKEGGGGYHPQRSIDQFIDQRNFRISSLFLSSLRGISNIFSIFYRFWILLLSFCGNFRDWRSLFNLQRINSGVIMMLLILFVPIALFSIKYSQKLFERRQNILEKAEGAFFRKYDPAKVAVIIAKVWDHLKTLGNQQLDSAYEAAFNSGVWCQNSALGGAIDGIILSNGSTTGGTSTLATSGPADAPTTSADKAAYAKKDITVAVENDKIKVTYNNKSVYALPAECNLDLVLAVPTNSDAAVTEIGKASASFLKDNFCNTRGVYASVIPYSGKLSLPSNRYDGWAEALTQFTPKDTSEARFKMNLTLYELYGTRGIQNTSLSTKYNDSGSSNGCSIMYRSKLFDSTNASSLKYKRMNLNPCTIITTALFDAFVCPVNCTTYTANPHAMIEPVSDLSTAYTKCNGLTLPSDNKNTSSFSFAALEWANNMFQNWTNDPQTSAVAGGNNGILSSQAKTTSGRKKAVVLIVNKPDTFTAGELTYLGLTNDADEIYISDELKWTEINMPSEQSWTSVCYGNGKFVVVVGGKEGAYSNDGISWSQFTLPVELYWSSVCYGDGKFVAISCTYPTDGSPSDISAWSRDGINWNQSTLPSVDCWWSVCYGDGKFVAASSWNTAAYSTNGINWAQIFASLGDCASICYGNGKFIAIESGTNLISYSIDGINWVKANMPQIQRWESVCYGSGKFIAVGQSKEYSVRYKSNTAAYSNDGINWIQSILPVSDQWCSVCYGGGKFVAIACGAIFDEGYKSNIAAYSSDGINWTQSALPVCQGWESVCYGGGKFVAVAYESDKAACGEFVVKTNTVGNKALKDALGDGAASGVTNLTTNACNKLKQAYGSDIRIYLVKYRKSAGDYKYLDDCATSTGGKTYDVANATDLKTTLDTIAADLKTWAGYQEARIVD